MKKKQMNKKPKNAMAHFVWAFLSCVRSGIPVISSDIYYKIMIICENKTHRTHFVSAFRINRGYFL